MKLPRVLLRTNGDFIWADCQYVRPPRVVEFAPMGTGELDEFKRMGIEAAPLAALAALRRTGDLSRLPWIVTGFLLAHSELKGKAAAVALPPASTLNELKLSVDSLSAISKALGRALKTEINLGRVKLSATVDDVVALVKNQLVPVHGTIAEEISRWAQHGGTLNQIDAGAMAYMAAEKWTATCNLGLVAGEFSDLMRFVAEDENADVSAMLVLRHEQLPVFPIGVCLFHRTWTNNLFVDYLAGHPAALGTITGIAKDSCTQLPASDSN